MTPPGIALRDYRPGDAAACAAVFARAWAAGHPHAPRRIDREAFETAIVGRTLVLAQDASGVVVGFAGVDAPEAFIHHLYVDPPASGRGVGRALLEAALALAGGRASLKCHLRNGRALAFYERVGWRRGEEGGDGSERWVRLSSPPAG
jgi:GNAT superfamily N-acetyltransferase